MANTKKPKQQRKLAQYLPYILIVTGIIGIVCAFIITVDHIKILENPHYIPSCNVNPIIACGNVISSKEGQVFGFPNSFLGLAAFAATTTIGFAILAGGIFKKWFWQGLVLGSALGVAFSLWLFYNSVYVIHALCPYCMTTWAVTITTFWYSLMYALDIGALPIPKGRATIVTAWIRRHHLDILIGWLLIIAALILKHFWYYFGKNI